MDDAAVVAKFRGLAAHIARGTVPTRDVDDATQDGLIGAVRAHHRFNPDLTDNYVGWMRVAIRRAIIDGQRKRSGYNHNTGRSRVEVILCEGVAQSLTDRGLSPDAAVIADDFGDYLKALFDGADARIVAGLLAGRSQLEMAEEEGVTQARICQRVRAIRELVARRVVRAEEGIRCWT